MKGNISEALKEKTFLIDSTARLLLVQVKMLLDNSMLSSGNFKAALDNGSIVKVVKETISILQG